MHAGAGKTTLLDVLSGRRQGSSIAGVICLNGHRATPAQVPLRGVTGCKHWAQVAQPPAGHQSVSAAVNWEDVDLPDVHVIS